MLYPCDDPAWLQGLPSPYYKETHRRFQAACREFIDENLNRHALSWEREERVDPEVWSRFAKANLLVPCLAAPLPTEWLEKLGLDMFPGGVRSTEFDDMHTLIYFDEMARSGLLGIPGFLTAGMAYGVPPIVQYGSERLKERFLPDLLTGRKRTCIAVTEPDAGSDVANLTTTAEKSTDRKHYIVNGTKKWITNGIWADYATMAVRTGGEASGAAGISLLIVPLNGQSGVTRRKIEVGGGRTAGTAFIELDDVHVPIENLIGEEGKGFSYVMNNFNHERLVVAISVTRQARVALSQTYRYCTKREAFGKSLMDQPVVRNRLATCTADLEALTAWLEQFAYQLAHMPKKEADDRLGGLTALAKAQAGKVLDRCARCATLLHGGNGFTRHGQGELVEKIYREVNGARVPGGSEDVMLDLATRHIVKFAQRSQHLQPGPRL